MTGKRNLLVSRNRTSLRCAGRAVVRTLYCVRPPNPLVSARRELDLVMRLHRKWIKEMPEVFDPQVLAQRRREAEEERWRETVMRPLLDRVYASAAEVDRSPKMSTGLQTV